MGKTARDARSVLGKAVRGVAEWLCTGAIEEVLATAILNFLAVDGKISGLLFQWGP